ncbi:unnamed protein product [Acidithrix sp. C25]|nr:unnamed protein product [Acidithrix sp. C25]
MSRTTRGFYVRSFKDGGKDFIWLIISIALPPARMGHNLHQRPQ